MVTPPNAPTLVIDYPTSVDLEVEYVRKDQAMPDGCSVRHPEETVDSQSTPVEQHFVHENRETGRLLVLGLFLRRAVQIENDTVNRFQQLFPQGNARATQPLNGRVVRLFPGRLG